MQKQPQSAVLVWRGTVEFWRRIAHAGMFPARFQVQRRLGAGGFGVVYEAYDRERETIVALKELARTEPVALYRFKREFRALSDLAHPNLVTLYELISHEDRWFLAMELIRGVSFLDHVMTTRHGDVLSPSPGLPPAIDAAESAVTVTRSETSYGSAEWRDHRPRPAWFDPDRLRAALGQLVAGVRHLHQNGILHRDIKPSNILVTGADRVVLLDFGLALEFSASETSAHRVGTPEYMSPEQGAGDQLTEASDWYSVGVVLYRALTGQLPFTGSIPVMLADKRAREAVPAADIAPDLPEDLASLCRALLRRDPADRPTGADIAERLSGALADGTRAASSAAVQKAQTFVGRSEQLAALKDALETTKSGKAVTVYIQGMSGMGKTALVRHFLRGERDADRHLVVLAGRCYEQEAVPYKTLDSAVDALAEYLRRVPRHDMESLLPRAMWALARVFPVLERLEEPRAPAAPDVGDSFELRRRASGAFRELLGRLAERRRLVVFIDDLQWGDADSAVLLADLLRPPDPPPLLLIACYRGEESARNPVLRSLLNLHEGGGGDVRTLDVEQLSPLEAHALARALARGDQWSQGRVEAAARESGGHPFFIDQLIRHGQSVGDQTTLESVLLDRADLLPPDSRTLLEVTALAGRPLELAIANTAAGLEPGDYNVVAALRAAQFVRTRASRTREIEPYHDRVRETIVASISPAERRALHRRLGDALEAGGRADPEALAVHFEGAGDNHKAAQYALTAAEQAAAALAFDRAARLYRRSLDLEPRQAEEHRRLQIKFGDALAAAGRVIEAAQAYLGAAEGAGATQSRELRRQAGEQFLMGGYLKEGLAILRSLLSSVGLPLMDSHGQAILRILLRRPYMLLRGTHFQERPEPSIAADELWRIDLCHSAVRSLGFTETIHAIELQMRHLLLALKVGEPYRVARALGFEAIADARQRRSRPRAERLLATVRSLADHIPEHHALDAAANVHVTAGMLSFLSGGWKNAAAELQQAERIFRDQSALPYKLVVVQVYMLTALYYQGAFSEYFRRVPECLKESLDRGNAFAEANLRLQNAHRKCFGDDRPDAALDEVQEAMARWSPRGYLQIHSSELFHRADFALYRGDASAARTMVEAGWPKLRGSHLLMLQTIHLPARYLRARAALAMACEAASAAARGDRRAFLKSVERDVRHIERERAHWGVPLAALLRAGVASTNGDASRAVQRLIEAEQGFERADMALHAAAARSRRGVLTGGVEGRALSDSSNAWMTGQGIRNPARMVAMLAPGRYST